MIANKANHVDNITKKKPLKNSNKNEGSKQLNNQIIRPEKEQQQIKLQDSPKIPLKIKILKSKNKICSKCDTTLTDDGLFCHTCGKSIHTEVRFCAYCGTFKLKDANFCHKCGNTLKTQIIVSKENYKRKENVKSEKFNLCSLCGVKVESHGIYCSNCGNKLI